MIPLRAWRAPRDCRPRPCWQWSRLELCTTLDLWPQRPRLTAKGPRRGRSAGSSGWSVCPSPRIGSPRGSPLRSSARRCSQYWCSCSVLGRRSGADSRLGASRPGRQIVHSTESVCSWIALTKPTPPTWGYGQANWSRQPTTMAFRRTYLEIWTLRSGPIYKRHLLPPQGAEVGSWSWPVTPRQARPAASTKLRDWLCPIGGCSTFGHRTMIVP